MHANQDSSLVSSQSNPANFSNQFLPSQTKNLAGELDVENGATEEGGTKGHALVVDDAADVTDMLSVLLEHAGWEVVTAASATAALAAARQEQFDIIISDIGMPVMNGYDLARTLRSEPGYETVPMVAVTGYSMYDDRERSLAAGFDAHLTKPVEPHVLLDLIENLRN